MGIVGQSIEKQVGQGVPRQMHIKGCVLGEDKPVNPGFAAPP
jgi:hypothetical protein